jgi:hypothetical protein
MRPAEVGDPIFKKPKDRLPMCAEVDHGYVAAA